VRWRSASLDLDPLLQQLANCAEHFFNRNAKNAFLPMVPAYRKTAVKALRAMIQYLVPLASRKPHARRNTG